ncbi:MAG: hypothetical protein ABIC40_02325, partial [bacterium]
MKSIGRSLILAGVILVAILALYGCQGNKNNPPTIPENPSQVLSPASVSESPQSESTHYLWGYYIVKIDPDSLDTEIIPVREIMTHINVLKYLEQGPCTNCFKIAGISPGPSGTLNIDISIKHPFSSLNFTGFDVRGIAMFDGSKVFPVSGLRMSDSSLGDGELLNADGYTTLYNSTTAGGGPDGIQGYIKGKFATVTAPNATLNGYKRFSSYPANARNTFYSGDTVTVTYQIKMPKPFIFGYAIDANWAPPIHKPVINPMSDFGPGANCQEAWKIEVQDMGPGPTIDGGSTKFQIDVFDYQGKDSAHPVVLECPELFDGEVEASWALDGSGFTRYQTVLENSKIAGVGSYNCLIRKEASENNPSTQPWLDLTAYTLFSVYVSGMPLNPVDVTPPWLNFSPKDVCIDGKYCYIAGGVNGLHIFDLSHSSNPVWINWVDTPGNASGVTVSGGYAYIADEDSGLQIVDIDPPESAYIVNSVEMPDRARAVAVSGGYAFVADDQSGLQIVDIDPPESACIVNSIDIPFSTLEVLTSGDYAYATSYSGLYIIDIDPPESAYIVKSVNSSIEAYDAAVSEGYAYVANNEVLQIIDIDPPEEASTVKIVESKTNWIKEIAVSGGYAFVAGDHSDFQIIDIDPPESAYIAYSVGSDLYISGIAVSEGFA